MVIYMQIDVNDEKQKGCEDIVTTYLSIGKLYSNEYGSCFVHITNSMVHFVYSSSYIICVQVV